MAGQTATRPTILLLGCGHWSNPGLDFLSVEFDDMLAPRRQREIEEVLAFLKRFAPTKVALEVMADSAEELNQEYREYRAGTFALTANERHQLGFRLAAAHDHDKLYAIDWHDLQRPIGWEAAITFAEEHDQHALISAFSVEQGSETAATERERLHRTGVRDLLLEANDSITLADNHRVYIDLAQVGEDRDYIGADVVLRWYERNLKIFANMSRIITSPDERLLVIIGSGHLPLLTHFIQGAGRFTLSSVQTYLA